MFHRLREPEIVTRHDRRYLQLYHYVREEGRALEIASTGLMKPFGNYDDVYGVLHDGDFVRSRVNFTDVRPEEGRAEVSAHTSLHETDINYGLELLVPADIVVQAFPFQPRCYQIFTKEPVEVVVERWWNMKRVAQKERRGFHINRFRGPNGLFYACWEGPESGLAQPVNLNQEPVQ